MLKKLIGISKEAPVRAQYNSYTLIHLARTKVSGVLMFQTRKYKVNEKFRKGAVSVAGVSQWLYTKNNTNEQ